jgi:hypothetical protein
LELLSFQVKIFFFNVSTLLPERSEGISCLNHSDCSLRCVDEFTKLNDAKIYRL